MEFIVVFFIFLSLIMIGYVVFSFSKQKRAHLLQEIFFLAIYSILLLIVIFPKSLRIIEDVLGIQSALNFGIYLSIFILFSISFIFYKILEKQRVEITKLTREIAYLKVRKK